MSAPYETFGPFDLVRDGNKVRKEAIKDFWKLREVDSPGLSGGIGIYIFAVKVGKNIKPWYVGKTDMQCFKDRLSQQIGRFSDALDLARNGQIQIFLLARRTPARKAFTKPQAKHLASNDSLESMLIGSCMGTNKKLINASKVKHLKEISVPGYMNGKKGQPTKAAAALARMLK